MIYALRSFKFYDFLNYVNYQRYGMVNLPSWMMITPEFWRFSDPSDLGEGLMRGYIIFPNEIRNAVFSMAIPIE